MRVAVIGLGLIGGSVALAARRGLGATVAGFDADADAMRLALERGVVDVAGDLGDAEIVVVAVPVPALAATVADACERFPGAMVTDVGSTKRALAERVTAPNFIGGHPLAGAEASGIEHARADLFDGATWYLTPSPATEGKGYERLHRFVSALGARPTAIGADDHDRIMAAVSHLPHLFANLLVAQATAALGTEHVPATGPSFRDATRVAGANPPLWSGIYQANRDALLVAVDESIRRLQELRGRIGGDEDLTAWQQEAADQRQALLEVGLTGGERAELRVAVPNRPGVVADLALALGRAGINISDMSLAPSPDNTSGVVALWVGAADAERAAAAVDALELPVTR